MVTWKEFAAAEPDLANVGRSLLYQFKVGLAFLATVREDGAPRLHPVCPVLSNDRLFVPVSRLHRSDTIWCGMADTRCRRSRSPGLEATSSTSQAKPVWSRIRRCATQSFATPSTWRTRLKSCSSCGSIGSCIRDGTTC